VEEPAVALLLLVIPTREHKRGAEELLLSRHADNGQKKMGAAVFPRPFFPGERTKEENLFVIG
jgi:hypothetical protein